MVNKVLVSVLIVIMGVAGMGGCASPAAQSSIIPTTILASTTANSSPTGAISPAVALATNLDVPWAMAFLPDGNIIFTERPGRVMLYEIGKGLLPNPLLTLQNVAAVGEGGLLGIAVHPDFSSNHYIYLYYTVDQPGGAINRVERYVMEVNTLKEDKVILDEIPAGTIHNGGRIKFGPDGYLYITAGDAGDQNEAQNTAALNGKIHRVKDDGSIPSDNPFPGSSVYSYGHRNPEGLAWDSQGRLWETENGPTGNDEINIIEAGKNYGWPIIQGGETKAGMVTPVLNSGPDTWAPSGTAFYQGNIYFTGLRGVSLFEAVIGNTPVTLNRYLQGAYGRLREVVVGPDGYFYIFTNNTDGRGAPAADDDKLLRIDPRGLK